jgi:LacI family transcriptional regulator
VARHTPVTLVDVAKRAGVSLSTASRVINGSVRQVTPGLAQRVTAAAADLGYTPNAQAQALARNASNVVGLVAHDISDPYFSSIINGAMRVADRHGLIAMVANTFRDPQREVEYVGALRAHRVRAIIIVGTRNSGRAITARLAAELTAFEAAGGRAACVSQPRLPIDTVAPENRAGGRDLARQMIKLGHHRFAALTAPRTLLTSRDRLAGFRDGLAEAGLELPDDQVAEGAFTRDGGYTAAVQLLDRKLDATCLVAVSDVMALGAMSALRERGVVVPGELSVAGFDDIATLRDFTPALTTVRLPLEEMGVRAAELALDTKADRCDGSRSPRTERIPAEVVLRESTLPPHARRTGRGSSGARRGRIMPPKRVPETRRARPLT